MPACTKNYQGSPTNKAAHKLGPAHKLILIFIYQVLLFISSYSRHLSADPAMAGVRSAGLSPERIERSSFTQEYGRGEESKQCVICITGQA